MSQITLNKTADISQRLQILTLLREKAEKKVYHADTFRQRNMNYALVIFVGIIAVEMKLGNEVPHRILSTILVVLMTIFTIWDQRGYRMKYGWEATSRASFEHMVNLANNPNQDISVSTYVVTGEKTAGWSSWQASVFYVLVVASIASYWVLGK